MSRGFQHPQWVGQKATALSHKPAAADALRGPRPLLSLRNVMHAFRRAKGWKDDEQGLDAFAITVTIGGVSVFRRLTPDERFALVARRNELVEHYETTKDAGSRASIASQLQNIAAALDGDDDGFAFYGTLDLRTGTIVRPGGNVE